MVRLLIGSLLALAVLYLAIVMLAWLFQAHLIYPAPQHRVEPLAGYREVTLQTSDGLSLRAFARRAEGGLPTIVYFHGNGSGLDGCMTANAMFAEAGYGLLLVNYRGYGGNQGEPSEQGFYRDGRAAFSWLQEQGVAPAETIIIGNSIGSGTATQMAVEYTPRALILSAPFSSLTNAAADAAGWLPVRALLRDRFENEAKIGKLEMPVLVQHGTVDRVVPSHHGKRVAALAKFGELQLFEGFDHDQVFLPETQIKRFSWVERLALR